MLYFIPRILVVYIFKEIEDFGLKMTSTDEKGTNL